MRVAVIVFLLMAVSCKHEPILHNEAEQSKSYQYVLHTGDSLQLPQLGKQVSIMPEIGHLNAQQFYCAPQSLFADSQHVKIQTRVEEDSIIYHITLIKRNPNDSIISFSQTILPLMKSNCNFSGCHGNGSRAGLVSLENYEQTQKVVYAYQPLKSLLFLSLIKPDPIRRMPPAGPLSNERLNYFFAWIEQGAHDN
jgi:hypothetical protein